MKSNTVPLSAKAPPQKLTGIASNPQFTKKLIDSKCAQAGTTVGTPQGAAIATQVLNDMAVKPSPAS